MARLTPPKSPIVCEKHQRGCMWRLYGLFDFRQGRSAKKLISDKKHSNRFDRKILKMKLDLLTNLDEKSQSMDDKMMNKASEAKNGKTSYSVSVEKFSDKLNSEKLAEEAHGKRRSGCGCKSINDEITPQAHAKSAEAIMNQKFIDEKFIRENGVNYQSSRQLSDALEILNSDKELFLELLQDPNSLLAKRIEGIRESQVVKHWMKSPWDGNFSAPKQCDVPADTRKLKSCDTVVVLKPGPTSMRHAQENTSYSLRNNRQKEIHAGNFSFSRIKKNLRYAIGVSRKEQYSPEDTTLHRSACKGVKEGCERKGDKFVRINCGGIMISPLDIKKRDNISLGREFGSDIQCENASTSGSSFENSSISDVSESSLEAMLLELLTNGNKDRRHEMQDQKILEGVVSIPEYDFLPTRSPVGLSPYSDFQHLYEDKWRLQKEQISCLSPTENEHNFLEENACRNGTTEINEIVPFGETNASEDLRISDCIEKTSTVDTDDTLYQGETDPAVTLSKLNCEDQAIIYEDDEYFKSSFQDQLSTSSPDIFQSPPRIERLEDSASIEDKGEHPSPISVLEPFFVDSISKHGEEHHYPHPTGTSNLNEHEIIEYIQAVLQAASLDWDEISMMRDASVQLLDPFLLDRVKLQGNQLHGDCILLFDCIDEVLVDVCCSDLRHSPWLSFIKPTLRQLPLEETVIQKVLKYVEWHNTTPRTMQQVVEKDIAPSVTWLDIRKDAEDVVFQIVEDVLEELIIETIVQLQLMHIFMAKFTCYDDDTKIQLQLCITPLNP